MYKTQYKKALQESGETPETLVTKTKKAYDDTVDQENALATLARTIKDANPEDIETIQSSITQSEEYLQAMDNDLCKRIAKNQSYKDIGKKLTDGRLAKKSNGNGHVAPDAAPVVKIAPVVNIAEAKEGEAGTETVKAEAAAHPNGTVKPVSENVEQKKNTPAPVKVKTEVVKVEKNGKMSTSEVVGWTVGGVVGLVALWFGIPVPSINKKAFTFWPKR